MDKNKNINLSKSAQIAGKEWYHLGDIQRKQYAAESEASWKQFRSQIEEYKKNDGYNKWNEFKKTLPNKSYPRSPLAIYIRQNYQKLAQSFSDQHKTNKEIMQSLVEQWKNENDFTKDQYRQIWKREKEQFISQYGQYLKQARK